MNLSTRRFMLAAGGAGGGYWYATITAAGPSANGVAVDVDGSVYIVGVYTAAGSNTDILLAKYANNGAIQWQRSLAGSSPEEGNGIALDGTGNVYIAGATRSQGAGNDDALLAKYNSSGAIQWQRSLGRTGYERAHGIAVDSSGYIYIAGDTDSQGAGNQDALFAKYSGSGVIQWQASLGGSLDDVALGVSVDASGNVYSCGYTNSQTAGNYDYLIAKHNTSGALQWQRRLGGSSSDQGYAVAVDASGNVYVTGRSLSIVSGSAVVLAKYNNSGTLQWQRSLTGSQSNYGNGVAVDNAGNIYIAGRLQPSGGTVDILIAKYNSAGAIQWQRSISSSGTDEAKSIAVDNKGSIYIAGTFLQGTGANNFFLAKLPGDGSLTGTFGSFTISASTLTDAASSLTAATTTLTAASRTLTDAARTLTDAATTFTSTTTTIG